ncbi:FAD:protein FMN transferase [Sulfobacillus thermosulfidooxidans]|uniref:FAD:protein FMN transferase n=1 Tax=Sulfobacillus thermosulfidooxidans TaxID=28034 RepID=UPI0006B4839F|nr:FAD:protein FMN transferase [Sulfobacillus thermosulfidooxidans]
MASPVQWLIDGDTFEGMEQLENDLRILFRTVERRLSRFQENSEAVWLNRNLGQWVSVSDVLYAALAVSHRAWRLTGGLFDPRVIIDLERLGYVGAQIPFGSHAEAQWLERRPRLRQVRLHSPVDFGGIGKSLVVFWGARLITRYFMAINRPLPPMLLNAGGDMQMLGSSVPEPGGWQVGVEHPVASDQMGMVLTFPVAMAVCTSSIRIHQWFHQGRNVHHLINPLTHEPGGEGLLSVTVAHQRPTWAEVWSKALFLQGTTGIADFAHRHRLNAWWFTDDGKVGATQDAWHYITWLHPTFVI